MTILGFDFGLKYIGVACGQQITQTATPLTSLKAKDGIPEWSVITSLIATWRPVELIVGLPLNMDGSWQEMTFCANSFAKKLRKRYQLPVHMVDERLSTWEAKQSPQAKKVKIKKNQDFSQLNAEVAAILVKQWLNEI
jgi:putative holliday junction resolvase